MVKGFTLNCKITPLVLALLLGAGTKIACAQSVPNISYSTPQVYTVGTAISTLSPTNTGGAVYPANYGTPASFASVNTPYTVAIDASNNVYANDEADGNIYKYNSSGTNTQTIITPYFQTTAAAIDGLGNIYVSAFGNNVVLKYNSAGTLQSTITGFSSPYGICFDASNNVYVADSGTGNIIKIAAGTTTTSTFLSGFTSPYGVAMDASGNLFVSQPSLNNIIKVASGTSTKTTFYATSLSGPRSLTKDASGNIYVADYGNNAVKRINSSGTLTLTLSTGLSSPRNIAFDSQGNMFEADYGTNTIQKLTATSYSISATLPAGLSFSTSTGQITGTPTTVTAATTYTITAYNTGGSASTTLTITVSAAAYGNYAFQKTITLNNAAVGMSSNQTNFPALISVQDNALIIKGTCADAVQNPNGPNYDFAFMDPSSATELNYQVESYNQTTGTLLVWVKIPTLYAATNNTLTFYFGSLSPPTTHNTAFFQATWASDYQAVYHFNESAYTGSVTDNTSNGHTGTTSGMTSADLVTGKIGNGYSFNGSSKKISVNPVNITGAFTISAWIKLGATGIDQKIMTNQGTGGYSTGGYKLGVYTNNIPEAESGLPSTRYSTPTAPTLSSGTWYYVQGVFTGTTLSVYVNGSQYAVNSTTTAPFSTNNFYIGVGEGGNQFYFNGIIDEPRVSNVGKSADWLKAEYTDQNNPVTFTDNTSTVTTNVTNAAAIPGALTYTWTGATSTDPTVATNWNNTTAGTTNQLPAFTGTTTLIIPAGLTNYPSLTANESIYGLTIASGASLSLNGHTLSVGCNIYNSSTGTIKWNSNTASAITWNGSSSAQTYTGSSTLATGQLGSMTVNNSAGGTVTISGGPLDIYNQLTITKGNLVVGSSPAALTLKSTATLTATVNAITTGYSITGTVNAERFVTGGTGYRGYRLISSPVYGSTDSYSNKIYTINYLSNSSYITGTTGTTGGFDKTGNPTLYLYRENLAPSNASFTSGNFRGVNTIGTAPNYAYLIDGDAGTFNVPVGNGFLFFFRGDRSVGTLAAETLTSYVPTNTTLTASGTLNQGQIIVHDWYTPSSQYLGWTNATANSAVRGFNLVGNPYASSIDWETYNTSTTTTGIYANNLGTTIWELNPVTKNYATYQKGGINTNNGSNIIASGQGFFVQASNSTNPQLIFNESAKSTTQNTGVTLFMSSKNNITRNNNSSKMKPDQHLRLQLAKDSINTDDIYIGFNSGASARYVENEDAAYKKGNGEVSLSSFSADSVQLSINKLALPHLQPGIIPLFVTARDYGTYSLNMTEMAAIPRIYEVWLMDKFKKDSLDIGHNPSYAFDITTDTNSYGSNRFSLIIRQNPALGVHLLDFTAAKASNGAQIVWKTENEEDYTYFTVERSTNGGISFDVLGGFPSNAQGTYSLLDKNPMLTTDEYRLKLEDLNGTITYSKVVTLMYGHLNNNIVTNLVNIYPNPASGIINLTIVPAFNTSQNNGQGSNLPSVTPATYDIKIVNNIGSVLKTATSGQDWQTDVSNLIPGTYIIQVTNNQDKSLVGTAKFIKM